MTQSAKGTHMDYTEELWLPVVGFEDLYEVSNKGRVRRKDSGLILKPVLSGKEHYYCVSLWRNNNSKVRRIHRLVAEAFLPNPDNKPCIDHIDTNCLNNCLENLKWCSYKENSNNPLTLKHNSDGQITYSAKEGVKEKRSKKMIETRSKYKETFDKITEKLVSFCKSEEGRKRNSEAQKRHYQQPGAIEKARQVQIKSFQNNPERARHLSEIGKERMRDPKEREKIMLGSLHRARPLKCVETGEEFLSGGQADRHYGLWKGSANCCATRGIGAKNGKLHFVFIDSNNES